VGDGLGEGVGLGLGEGVGLGVGEAEGGGVGDGGTVRGAFGGGVPGGALAAGGELATGGKIAAGDGLGTARAGAVSMGTSSCQGSGGSGMSPRSAPPIVKYREVPVAQVGSRTVPTSGFRALIIMPAPT
jgi:hypothetical protein